MLLAYEIVQLLVKFRHINISQNTAEGGSLRNAKAIAVFLYETMVYFFLLG